MERVLNYDKGFRIVSIAKEDSTRDDLLKDGLDFLYINKENVVLYPDGTELDFEYNNIETLKNGNDYDVYELWPDGTLHLRYDDSTNENYFFITGRCNSNCIMCPSPDASREKGVDTAIEDLITLAYHIPRNTSHLTITGGEPFIIGERLFDFLEVLKQKFDRTQFLILTNGRVFALKKYIDLLLDTIPANTTLAIPIHGSTPQLHDQITQVENSFAQTITGIKELIKHNISIEIRIVISKLNAHDFNNIAKLICREFPGIAYVSVMATEMTGSARINKDRVWIPYKESFAFIAKGIEQLISNGIDVRIYNYPLCTVDEKLRTLCVKSISPEKVRFLDICDACRCKDACGGFFAGTYSYVKDEITPLV